MHDRRLEQAVYALDPTLPDLPAGTLWTTILPAHALPQAPAPPPAPVPKQKVKAYLRSEQGQVRKGASVPTGAPICTSRVAPLPLPPPPPGAGGVIELRVVRSSVPIPPAGGGHSPACRVFVPSPPPPPASGGNAPARGLGGPILFHPSASGSYAHASGLSAGGGYAPASGSEVYEVQPPLPHGPPPARAAPVSSVGATRRTFASASARVVADRFSRSMNPGMSSAIVRTFDTAGRIEIVSDVDDESASIVDDTVEDNLNIPQGCMFW